METITREEFLKHTNLPWKLNVRGITSRHYQIGYASSHDLLRDENFLYDTLAEAKEGALLEWEKFKERKTDELKKKIKRFPLTSYAQYSNFQIRQNLEDLQKDPHIQVSDLPDVLRLSVRLEVGSSIWLVKGSPSFWEGPTIQQVEVLSNSSFDFNLQAAENQPQIRFKHDLKIGNEEKKDVIFHKRNGNELSWKIIPQRMFMTKEDALQLLRDYGKKCTSIAEKYSEQLQDTVS